MGRTLRSIMQSVAWVTSSTYVSAGLSIVRGLLWARILGPAAYGVWGFLSTVQSLSLNADAGVAQVVERDMPGLLAAGRKERADQLASVTALWTPFSTLIAGVVLAVLWPVFGWPSADGWFVLVPALLLGWGLFTAALTIEQGHQAFRRLSVLTMAAGVAGLVFGTAMSVWVGVSGLVVSQATVYGGAALIALGMRGALRARPGVFDAWKHAIREGWTLLLPYLALQAFVSLDMLVAASAVSVEEVGLYSIALLGASMVANVIASSVGMVVGQHLVKEAAISEEEELRPKLVWGPAAALAVALAPLCAVAALLVPYVLGWALPEYVDAVAPAVVLMAASYFLNTQFGFSTAFVAARKPLAPVPVFVGVIVLNVIVDVVLLRAGWGLLAIATGSVVANVCFVIAHEMLVARVVCGGRKQWLQGATTLLAGGLPLAAALHVLEYGEFVAPAVLLGAVGWVGLAWLTLAWLRDDTPGEDVEGPEQ